VVLIYFLKSESQVYRTPIKGIASAWHTEINKVCENFDGGKEIQPMAITTGTFVFVLCIKCA